MALSKIQPASMDLTANYAFTGTNSISTIEYAEKKLATVTASSSATLSFTTNIDSTYNIYKFRFIDMHPSAYEELGFQCSIDGGSNYNTQITSTFFQSYNVESNSGGQSYLTGYDQANGTNFQRLNYSTYTDNDSNLCGELFIFDPSSTTFVKHFYATTAEHINNGTSNAKAAGYFNTTSAINAIQFKMESGNIDSGTIEMYGIN